MTYENTLYLTMTISVFAAFAITLAYVSLIAK